MSHSIPVSAFLRRVLLADALVGAAMGTVMVSGASAMQDPLGLPAALLRLAGASMFPYAAYLLWLTRRTEVPRAAVWVPIVINLVWALDCAWLLFGGAASPTPLGQGFVAMQVAAVLLFAELEYIGLRRACAIVAA